MVIVGDDGFVWHVSVQARRTVLYVGCEQQCVMSLIYINMLNDIRRVIKDKSNGMNVMK